MNEQPPAPALSTEDYHGALFASLVMQQTNMALVFLGRTPNPEAGQPTLDLDGASRFIDTLEMLSLRTKGNLPKTESDLLQQSLTMLRMMFVEAVDTPSPAPSSVAPSPAPGAAQANAGAPAAEAVPPPPAADDDRKRFVKKY